MLEDRFGKGERVCVKSIDVFFEKGGYMSNN